MKNRIEGAMQRLFAAAVLFSAGAACAAAGSELDALKQACASGDRNAIHRSVGSLTAAWGKTPDFGAIGAAIADRSADPTYRWVMIDSLVRYKRSVKSAREAKALLAAIDAVSRDGEDLPGVRAKALTVEAGMISLFREQGFLGDGAGRDFGKRLAGLIGRERNGELVAAACIAAGIAGADEAAPAMRRHVRGENAPSLVRRTAAGSLGRLKDRESIPLISDLMGKTNDRELYGSSAFALGSMGGEEVVEPLVKHAGRFDTHSCANALRRNSGELKRMVKDPGSPRIEDAIRAVELAGMKECLPDLEALERDGREGVRDAARRARETLGRQPGGPPPGGDGAAKEVQP